LCLFTSGIEKRNNARHGNDEFPVQSTRARVATTEASKLELDRS